MIIRIILVPNLGLELASRVNYYDDFMKYDEDKVIIDYCWVNNSKIKDNDDVVLQN